MPRYFFHTCTRDRLFWDSTGLDLPDIANPEDPELTCALWSEVLNRQSRLGRTFVVMDEIGKVVFIAGF